MNLEERCWVKQSIRGKTALHELTYTDNVSQICKQGVESRQPEHICEIFLKYVKMSISLCELSFVVLLYDMGA